MKKMRVTDKSTTQGNAYIVGVHKMKVAFRSDGGSNGSLLLSLQRTNLVGVEKSTRALIGANSASNAAHIAEGRWRILLFLL